MYSARNRFTALLPLLAAALLASPPCLDGQDAEKAALEALYNATDGPNWTRSMNWLTENPISLWEGVVVVDDKVQSLNLYGNQLSGSIPATLGNLSSLRQLWLDSNRLAGTIPPELGHLNNINELSFWGNSLAGDVPDTLTGVTERTALAFLLAVTSTDGAPWVNRAGWAETSVPLSQWFGVSTDDQGRVTELGLPANGLSRDFPRMVEALYKMRSWTSAARDR